MTPSRPGLERLSDRAAEGAFDVLLCHAPDRRFAKSKWLAMNAFSAASVHWNTKFDSLAQLESVPDPDRSSFSTAWLAWASRIKVKPLVRLVRKIRKYRDGILAAVRLEHKTARLEGLNSKLRLISHGSYGFHAPEPLISLITLSRRSDRRFIAFPKPLTEKIRENDARRLRGPLIRGAGGAISSSCV